MNNVTTSYNYKVHYATLQEDGKIDLPTDMIDGWYESDLLEWDVCDVCDDNGEYRSVFLRNKNLEERLRFKAEQKEAHERQLLRMKDVY